MQLLRDSGASFVNDIANNNGKMVYDGSFKFGRSSSAFLSISENNFLGTNIVPGRIENQSAYRGELGGILGSIVTIKILCKQFGVTRGAVTIRVDCVGAIKACEGDRSVSCRWKCYYIIWRIKHEMQDSNIRVHSRHVASQQDDVKVFNKLDEWKKPTIGLTDTPRIPFGSTWRRVV